MNVVVIGAGYVGLVSGTCLAEGAASAEVVFVAVGTPPGEFGEADLLHVSAATEVGRSLRRYAVVVVKSAVLFDGRNVWDAANARAAGLKYYGVGRPS